MHIVRRPLVLVAALALVLAGGAALAGQSTPHRAKGVIFACAQKQGGRLRVVGGAGSCRRGEQPLSWNIQGPQGKRGPSGEAGSQGPAGASGAQGAAARPALRGRRERPDRQAHAARRARPDLRDRASARSTS